MAWGMASTKWDKERQYVINFSIGVLGARVIELMCKSKEEFYMQKQGIDALKRMAQMAKNRLRNKVTEKENKGVKSGGKFKVLYGDGVDVKSKIITREDMKLYGKVKAMLDENMDVTNPISRLIDYKVFNKLDSESKERYIFDLVDKYKKYKEKYNEEKKKEVV